jgi:hypothetical protein
MKICVQVPLCMLLLAAVPLGAEGGADRITLFPKLRVGQTFTYRIVYRSEIRTKTESAVVAPMAPAGGQTGVRGMLQVEVKDVQPEGEKTMVRLRTRFAEPDEQEGKAEKAVEFTLHGDGRVSDVKGLDALSPEEQEAWRDWVAQFGIAAVFPEKGVRPGEKWKTEESIPAAALAGLLWGKESTYVKDEPCSARRVAAEGVVIEAEPAREMCAVIVTTATLKQKSSPKDATPEDFKLHGLRTMGTARGMNEVIVYISLKTGLVVRATEDANQFMDVVVAKVDGTNRVHYNVDARSHSEVLLVVGTSLGHP